MFYDTDMIEDLDRLSSRLSSLVAYTQSLTAELQALKSRLSAVESERDALKGRLDSEGSQASDQENHDTCH